MYSVRLKYVCADCGADVPAGTAGCPNCGCKKLVAVKPEPTPPTSPKSK